MSFPASSAGGLHCDRNIWMHGLGRGFWGLRKIDTPMLVGWPRGGLPLSKNAGPGLAGANGQPPHHFDKTDGDSAPRKCS